jgi:hypothetical protein
MNRRYTKLVYEKWDDLLDIEEAIRTEDYSKSYVLEDGTIGRIDVYEPGIGLFKVSYRMVNPPFEPTVTEHFRLYPNTPCAVLTPPVPTEGGFNLIHSHHFNSTGSLEARYELHYDRAGRIVRRIKLSIGGERLSEEQENYDARGLWLSTTQLGPLGERIREYHRDDD